jgi:hypothetical protein
VRGEGARKEKMTIFFYCRFPVESDISYPKKLQNENILSDIYNYNTGINIFLLQ